MTNVSTGKYKVRAKAVEVLKHSQPSMLDQRISFYTDGDGNCMFTATLQAVFCTQNCHMQLRALACLEVGVGLHSLTYDKASSMCHSLLSCDILLPLTFTELWLELCTPGHSCSCVALVILSAVLQL